ncbi:hypothetical protein [Burkholderia gladioli]|uniref:hypothetical protein n=1 Tax=Burkholderia gladioli TaxID=28095 RepID=UPI000313783D|nr:hypothetical protein [Burkholderia gladioli]MBW5286935.1 hypothetical protein [Burkholderia gladioli]
MSDFRLYPATPIDGAAPAPAPAPRWQPNGPHGALAVVEGFSVWVERDAAGDFTVHYLGRTSPPVPSRAEARAMAPPLARERGPISARAHARQAGRLAALAGQDLAAASGHVSVFSALLAAIRAATPKARRPASRSARGRLSPNTSSRIGIL